MNRFRKLGFVGYGKDGIEVHSSLPKCRFPRLSENLVHLLAGLLTARQLQVSHRRFHVGVTEPLPHCAQIDASPQAPGSERLRALGNSLEIVQKSF
jgi:hypothetical protein